MTNPRELGKSFTYIDPNLGEVTVPIEEVKSDGTVERLAADCLAHPMIEERYRELAAEGKNKG